MAARFLDMALDDVAKSRSTNNKSPVSRRGGRGGGVGNNSPNRSSRPSPYGRSNTSDDRWTHDKYDESSQRGSAGHGSNSNNNNRSDRGQSNEGNAKIIVENLHYAVTLDDIKELFEKHAGPVKFAEVKYDPSGRSTGAATVLFKTPTDAAGAIKKLNGITLDGSPMKITYAPLPVAPRRDQGGRAGPARDGSKKDVFSRLGSSPADIASRLGRMNPGPNQTQGSGGRAQNASSQRNNNNNHQNKARQTSQPKSTPKAKPKTAEELDAEMDTYMGDATA